MDNQDERHSEFYQEKPVKRGPHSIYARKYPGTGPAIVLMHGFPDNLHLYDWLVPLLRPHREVVTFDFLGWGRSDKPAGYPYTASNQTEDLAATIDQLGLDRVVLVAHDASGPPAIDWALDHSDRVACLVLLNTYYHWMPELRRPPAIALYSTPVLRNVARFVIRRVESLDEKLYHWQVGQFVSNAEIRRTLLPRFYQDFRLARPAFWRLNDDLLSTVLSRRENIPAIKKFQPPVKIIFGAEDPYLNTHVARRFDGLFPHTELSLLAGAAHYVQVDRPVSVAELILADSQ